MSNHLKNVREFDELLAELDLMIKNDFLKFREELSKLAENYGLNTIFESETMEDSQLESLNSISENKGAIHNDTSQVSSGENNS
jgi:hypothetical protein